MVNGSPYHKAFYAGTSGLVLPAVNKAAYPEAFREQPRLVYYAALFNSIEINSSFYKIPQAATMQKWAALVPEGFRFTFKLWKGITHEKELAFKESDIRRFINTIDEVGEKKGALLVQFPPGVRIGHLFALQRLLTTVAGIAAGWDIAVEFRHSSLYTAAIDHLLTELNMTMVVHDLPASASPQEPLATPIVYLRFHGPNGRYRGSYEDNFLREYARTIRDWSDQGKRVYVYFNNTMGAAVANLQLLQAF